MTHAPWKSSADGEWAAMDRAPTETALPNVFAMPQARWLHCVSIPDAVLASVLARRGTQAHWRRCVDPTVVRFLAALSYDPALLPCTDPRPPEMPDEICTHSHVVRGAARTGVHIGMELCLARSVDWRPPC